MNVSEIVNNAQKHLSKEVLKRSMRVHSYIRQYIGTFLRERGFLEVPPVIISPLTDPLNHPHLDPAIDYYGTRYSLTKSMIFHKQMLAKELGSIFAFSPNIRLEMPEKEATGRHLSEFTQVDVERKGATREEMMALVEDLFSGLFASLNREMKEDLDFFGRTLRIPKKPFKKVKYMEAKKHHGPDFESILSGEMEDPFWIIDIPLLKREFYDREDPVATGVLLDMDLIYPEGFGEGLSGGEREYELERIRERIRLKNQTEDQFRWFLEYAKLGLDPSAGFGIGIERLTRYACGLKRIEEVHPFPKIPGRVSL